MKAMVGVESMEVMEAMEEVGKESMGDMEEVAKVTEGSTKGIMEGTVERTEGTGTTLKIIHYAPV